MKQKKLIIVGAGGHGKVILDIAMRNGYVMMGFLDDDPERKELAGHPIIGGCADAVKYAQDAEFVIGIGSNIIRERLVEMLDGKVTWATLIHPTAYIGLGVEIGEGTLVMPQASVNAFAKVGRHCIVNTSAVVEHDNVIEDFVHVSSGATLAGTVCVGRRTLIGAGSSVKNNISICQHVTVGVGAAVVKDITEPGIYVGVPARKR